MKCRQNSVQTKSLMHNNNVLNVFVTNRPTLFSVSVRYTLIKTRHKALIVNAKGEPDSSTVLAQRT